MKENNLPEELTTEEIAGYEAIAADLAKKYSVPEVHVYVGLVPETNERVVGYIKEPSYLQKLFALDKAATAGTFMSGEALREILTLKEESDPRTFEDYSCNDKFKLAMVIKCVGIVSAIQDSYKKK